MTMDPLRQEPMMFGVIPISLINELEESRQAHMPVNYKRQDWKTKE